MIRLEDRQVLARNIDQAHKAGARLHLACQEAGIDVRTLQRWRRSHGLTHGDRRPEAERPTPAHALTEAERARLLEIANEPRFANQPPARIVAALADEGVYIAREASLARLLRKAGQNAHRGRARAPRPMRPPSTHVANAPGQVWVWDMTYLPTPVAGHWCHLYTIMDLFSRKIIGFEVHDTDDSDHAAQLLRRTALAEGTAAAALKPVLHGDNGSTFKATSVLAMQHWLGISPSCSRPRVSNDNAHAEALFRTARYRPDFPTRGFASLDEARQWAMHFVHWYNHEHRHSAIRYVTPHQRHVGEDREILQARHQLYLQARERHPRRWSGKTRNWKRQETVTLNQERQKVVAAASTPPNIQPKDA